ncbi:collagen alpha-1(XXVIII) chain isoform X4 [Oryzias latipes]|uniref:collagen alpha-1(XXVIII) chain isoform X4 n=1 Tax=Oryzias latipes TaxID=8090 RepID=UPI000CE289DE|nr:collagen alpha-1(XXVIII) chain isoform X4 [Oryzias latipes]
MQWLMKVWVLALLLWIPAQCQKRRKKGQRDDNQVIMYEAKSLICPLEIMFLVDSSEKAALTLFEQQKQFVLGFSARLVRIDSPGWRVRLRLAVLQYSSTVSVEHNFRDWQDLDVFQSRVSSMALIGHGTYSAYAITNATKVFKQETSSSSLRVVLLMTDGEDHPRSPSSVMAAATAKQNGIRMFTIRLSGAPEQGAMGMKLRSMASIPAQQHMFSLSDSQLEDRLFQELSAFVKTKCQQPQSCGCEKGEQGRPGNQGEPGEPGSEGAPGPKGSNGEPGVHGRPGMTGLEGRPGGKGEKGTKGECGAAGTKGEKGDPGPPGPSGPKGEQGGRGVPGDPGPEGALGPKGERGPRGSSGPPGENGLGFPGPKGNKGNQGRPGPHGAPGGGEPGLQGPPGPSGIQGSPGLPGEGLAGPKGERGYEGPKGSRGAPGLGIKGDKGNAGVPGLPGMLGFPGPGLQGEKVNGISRSRFCRFFCLFVCERPFKFYFKGERGPIGPSGPRGPSGLGTAGSKGDQGFPGEPGAPGERGMGEPGSKVRAKSRSARQMGTGLSADMQVLFQGEPGPEGAAGIPGIPGEDGAVGAKGEMGSPGQRGLEGEPGTGISGEKGDRGERGPRGLPGSPGPIGPPGAKGEPGSTGISGLPGPAGRGFPGAKGDPGSVGSPGPVGAPGMGILGPKGNKGSAGSVGPPGHKGEGSPGPQGQPGPPGLQGETGPEGRGLPGPKGDRGSPGVLGLLGPPGIGIYGPKGFPGQPGPSGPHGLPGKGLPGPKGEPGFQGPMGLRGLPGDGLPGEKGDQGKPGDRGKKGEQGDAGAPGSPGPSGTLGEKGGPGLTKEEVIRIIHEICGCGVKCRGSPLELVFVIDSSESVGPENLEMVKDFVNALIDQMTVSWEASRVGVVLYSHEGVVVVNLQQQLSQQAIRDAVRGMPYLGEGTFTGTAIRQATQLFQASRLGVRKMALVFTDGQTDPKDSMPLNEAVAAAHADGIKTIAVGVRSKRKPLFEEFLAEIKTIASDPDEDHIYLVEDFRSLHKQTRPGSSSQTDPEEEVGEEAEEEVEEEEEDWQLQTPTVPPVEMNTESMEDLWNDLLNATFTPPDDEEQEGLELTSTLSPQTTPEELQESTPIRPHSPEALTKSPVSGGGCSQPLDPGPCRLYRVRWYFDPQANSCAQFWYGGCHGNQNNFETEEICRKACVFT